MSTQTIVCLGDSLTAFGTWPTALESRFSAAVINAGVGGNTILQGAARFETDVVPHAPQIVIIGFGTNDQVIYDPAIGPQVSPAVFRNTLRELITRSKVLGAAVVLLTPCVVDSEAYYSRHPKEWCVPYGGMEALLEQYRAIVRETAQQEHTMLIDIGALSADVKETVLGTPSHPDFDGVHPIDTGRALFDRWIGDAIQSLCENRKHPDAH